MKSVGMGRRRAPGGFQRYPQERHTQCLCRRDEMRGEIRTDEQGRDQQGVLALSLGGEGNEMGKAGLVGTKAFAGWIVPCRGASTVQDAEVAEFVEGMKRGVASHRPEELGEVVAHLPSSLGAVAPEPEANHRRRLERPQVGDHTHGGGASHAELHGHELVPYFVRISVPARVLRRT